MPQVFVTEIRVGTSAIDVHQHVNNQEYLRWLQDVATTHCEQQGWPMARVMASGASWYVKSHFIEYLRPALLDDVIVIATWLSEFTERNCIRHTRFLRQRDSRVLAEATTHWAFVSLASGRPLRIPAEIRRDFQVVSDAAEVLSAIAAQA